jgi:hypothetical protein
MWPKPTHPSPNHAGLRSPVDPVMMPPTAVMPVMPAGTMPVVMPAKGRRRPEWLGRGRNGDGQGRDHGGGCQEQGSAHGETPGWCRWINYRQIMAKLRRCGSGRSVRRWEADAAKYFCDASRFRRQADIDEISMGCRRKARASQGMSSIAAGRPANRAFPTIRSELRPPS